MERWDDMRLFLEVARQGTIAQAAEVLGVHQTTVFRRLKGLERDFDAQLFERTPAGYLLSEPGERLLATCTQIEALMFEAERVLRGHPGRLEGIVRLTTTATLMPLIADHIGDFCRAHPGVEVELLLDDREYRLAYMEADLALRPGPCPEAPQLVAQRVCGLGFALYASGAYLARHLGAGAPPLTCQRSPEPGSLRGHELIMGHERLAHLASEQWLRHLSEGARVALRSDNLTGLLEAARQGLGVVALPCFMVIGAPELVRLSSPQLDAQSALWLVLHAKLRHSARVRALADFLEQALSQRKATLEGR